MTAPRALSLPDRVPVWRLLRDQDVTALVTPALDYLGALRLRPLALDCASDEAGNDVGERLRRLVGSLEDESTLYLVSRVAFGPGDLVDAYQEQARPGLAGPEAEPVLRAYVKQRADWLGDQPFRHADLTLWFAGPNRYQGAAARSGIGLPSRWKQTAEDAHKRSLDDLRQMRERLAGMLGRLGMEPAELTVEEMRAFHFALLNPTQVRDGVTLERFLQRRDVFDGLGTGDPLREYTEAEALCAEDLVDDFGFVRQERVLRRVLNLRQLPEAFTRPLLAEPLRDLTVAGRPVPYTLGVGITVRNQAAAKMRLNAEHGLVAALRGVIPGMESAGSVSQEEEDRAKQGAIRGLFRELTELSSRLVHVSMSLLLEAEDTETLDAYTSAARDLFAEASEGTQLLLEPKGQVPALLSLLPGAVPYHPRRKGCTSRNAADLLPVSGPWAGCKRPMSVLRTPGGDPVPFDLFDTSKATAHHGLVAADTGSGKSMSFGALLLEAMAAGHELILVDNGGSYARMTRLLGGIHVPVDLNTSISPFGTYEEMLDDVDELDPTRVLGVVSYLDLCAADAGERGFGKVAQDVVGRAVRKVYEGLRGQPEARPLIGDFRDALGRYESADPRDMELARDAARRLDVYSSGIYEKLLNRPSKLRFDSSLITFDLKGLGDDDGLKALALATVAQAVTTRRVAGGRRTILVIDEGWNLLGDGPGVRLIEGWYRVLRKEGKAVWMISQAFTDFLSAGAGDAIVANAMIRLFLRARGGHDKVVDYFKLNPRAAERFRRLEMRPGFYSDLLMSYGGELAVLRMAMDPLAYWMLTTHVPDNEAFGRARDKNPTWSEWAVLQALAQRFPNGVEFTRR